MIGNLRVTLSNRSRGPIIAAAGMCWISSNIRWMSIDKVTPRREHSGEATDRHLGAFLDEAIRPTKFVVARQPGASTSREKYEIGVQALQSRMGGQFGVDAVFSVHG